MDVRIKFGDSGSNSSRDIRAAHFVIDDDERKTLDAGFGFDVLPKNGCLLLILLDIVT